MVKGREHRSFAASRLRVRSFPDGASLIRATRFRAFRGKGFFFAIAVLLQQFLQRINLVERFARRQCVGVYRVNGFGERGLL